MFATDAAALFLTVLEPEILRNDPHTPGGIVRLNDSLETAISLLKQRPTDVLVVCIAAWATDPLLCLYILHKICTVPGICLCQQALLANNKLRPLTRVLSWPGCPAVGISRISLSIPGT